MYRNQTVKHKNMNNTILSHNCSSWPHLSQMLVVSEDLMMNEELPDMRRVMFSHEALITDKKHSLADKMDHIIDHYWTCPGLKTLTTVFYPSHMPFSKRQGKKQGKNFTWLSLSARPKRNNGMTTG